MISLDALGIAGDQQLVMCHCPDPDDGIGEFQRLRVAQIALVGHAVTLVGPQTEGALQIRLFALLQQQRNTPPDKRRP